MIQKAILSFLMIFLFCSPLFSQKIASSKLDPLKEKFIFDSITNNKSKYKFCYVEKTNGSLRLYSIEIFTDNKLIQKIKIAKKSEDFEIYDEIHKEALLDYNFDGIKDISINTNCGATGHCSYLVWLYSKKDNQYHFAKELSGMGLELDEIGKNIIYHYREGWQAEYWDTYKYINGKFTWIKGVYQENTNTYSETTYQYLKNGKVVTKKVRN